MSILSLYCKAQETNNTIIFVDNDTIYIDSLKALQPNDTTIHIVNGNKSTKKYDRSKNKKNTTSGNISAGADYGMLPYTHFQHSKKVYYNTEGNTTLDIFKIPINLQFYYSTASSLSGLNNYFRISYDLNKYRENVKKELSQKIKIKSFKLDSLYKTKQELEQKKLYSELVIKDNDNLRLKNKFQSKKINNKILKASDSLSLKNDFDTLTMFNYKNNINKPDTIITNIKDSLDFPNVNIKIDTLIKSDNCNIKNNTDLQKPIRNNQHYKDSIADNIQELDKKIKIVTDKISEIKTEIKYLDKVQSMEPDDITDNPVLKPLKRFMLTLNKLELGTCNPDYSVFLVNGTTLRGINIEVESSRKYVAFTYGQSINTLLNNNILENNLRKINEMLNFFNFSDVSKGRRITAFKYGYGRKDDTHIHAGILYGTGQTTYLNSLIDENKSDINKAKNYVLEIDSKIKINSYNTIDIAYGKSSLQYENELLNSNEKGVGGVFQSSRTNAAQLTYKTLIKTTKTDITTKARWIDPFFISYGADFIRPDNFRYEIKAEQPLSKKIKINCSYKKGTDNLLNVYDYKNTITTIGTGISIKITKSISGRFSYNPILIKVEQGNEKMLINRNNITTGLLTYIPKNKKLYSVYNLMYNHYNISDGTNTSTFHNLNCISGIQINNRIKNSFNGGWINTYSTDSITELNSILVGDELSVELFKKTILYFTAKYLFNINDNHQEVGYGIRLSLPLKRNITAETGFEKTVTGDFYNNYYNEFNKDKLNYYTYLKLIYSW